jgi:hypothetical protein
LSPNTAIIFFVANSSLPGTKVQPFGHRGWVARSQFRFSPEVVMTSTKQCSLAFVAAAGLAVIIVSLAIADAKDAKRQAPAEIKLPPGWTEEDMQACMLAATPGKMHERLAKGVGVWEGKTKMWMMPGAEPTTSECTSTVTPLMDGRYTKCEIKGEMPGMGPFEGFGIYGFDNVSQKFVSSWVDNQGTGMMNGTGVLSDDGKVLSWKCTYNCPITKKSAVIRQIETTTSPTTMTLEMYGAEPKSGKEFKMMQIEFTKKSAARTGG